jgi:hypothetical protein
MTSEAAPTTVGDQLTALVDIVAALLGQNLAAIYVANGASNAGADGSRFLLVLTHRDLLRDRKYGLVHTFLRRSGQPAQLEVLVMRQADLAVEQPSVLVQLHYSEGLREHLAGEVGSTAWLTWVDGPTGAVDRGTLLVRLQGNRALVGESLETLRGAAHSEQQPVPTSGQIPPLAGGQQLSLGNA